MAPRPRRRRMRALGASVATAALLAGGGQAALAAPDVELDFTAPVEGTLEDATGQGTGFPTQLAGSTHLPGQLDLDTSGTGVLKVTTTSGDAAASPASQANALAVELDGRGGYVVETSIATPLDLTQPLQSAGIFAGVDQNNYVKVVARKSATSENQMQILIERQAEAGPPFESDVEGVSGLPTATAVNLRLSVAADGTATGEYNFGDGNWQPIGAFTLAAAATEGVTAGIIHTHFTSGTPFEVGYDSFTADLPPALTDLSPADGATDVPVDATVTATFDQEISDADLATAFTLAPVADPTNPVPAAVTLDASQTVATLTPADPLVPGTAYVATVGTGVEDTSGLALQSEAQTTFTTVAATTPPTPTPPSGAPAGSAPLCATVPPRPSGGTSGTIRLTPAQLLINQRISQAAVRRSNAVQAWLAAGVATQDLCGGGMGQAPFTGVAFGPAGTAAGLEPASPRPIVVAQAQRQGDPVALTADQLLINQRISQAAVRRSNALMERLDQGLTGGDVRDGAVTAGKLAPNLAVTGTTPAAPVPPSTTQIAAAPQGSGGEVTATVAQLRINQRISQAAVRRSNALIDRLQRGLTGEDFRNGTLTAADLAPALRQAD